MAPKQHRLVITPEGITREIEVAGQTQSDTRDLGSFAAQLGPRVPFETGIMPPGVLSLRQAGDRLQVVSVAPPGVNLVYWGRSEGDPNAGLFQLAQPWRIVLSEWQNGGLLGARMFYSPKPIIDLGQPLYHQNVPNLNCKGYSRGVGVGWVCLYHREHWVKKDGTPMSLGEKIVRVMERCSGVEAYNDANMSSTDGARFYAAAKKPEYFWNPKKWEAKSKKDGFEWTLDEDLLLPIKVADQDHQEKHDPKGTPLTLKMAMVGNAAAYYGDTNYPKFLNGFVRDDQKPSPLTVFTQIFTDAYNHSIKPDGTAPANVKATAVANPKASFYGGGACSICDSPAQGGKNITQVGLVCAGCADSFCFQCVNCRKWYANDAGNTDTKMCAICQPPCPKCQTVTGKPLSSGCTECTPHGSCVNCGVIDSLIAPDAGVPAGLHVVPVPAIKGEIHLCSQHFELTRICGRCGHAFFSDAGYETFEGEFLCGGCVAWCAACGREFRANENLAADDPNAFRCPNCVLNTGTTTTQMETV